MSTAELHFEPSDGVDEGALLGEVVPRLAAAIASVRPDDLAAPSPCEAWSTRDLLNHVIGGAAMFAEAFGGAPVLDISGRLPDVVGDDPMPAFERSAGAFGAAVGQPGAMDVVLELPFGPMTGRAFLRFAAFDLLVHTWDIASVTGHEVDVPDEVVAAAFTTAQQVLGTVPRSELLCGDAVEAPEGATPLEQLVAYAGRRP